MVNSNSVDILARTAWGENRGGGEIGMQSVMNSVLNRVRHGGWWGNTIVGVCQHPWQYSCWNADSDPNSDYQAMLAVTADDTNFAIALALAGRAIMGTLPDITEGADSYYAVSIPPPNWVTGIASENIPPAQFTVEIAGQRFYKTV